MRSADYLPKHCHHKATGRGYVKLDGKMHYTGRWGTAASRARYDEVLAGWLASRRRRPEPGERVTVAQLFDRWAGALEATGRHGSNVRNARTLARELAAVCGETPAEEFGPRRLDSLLQRWAGRMTRQGANRNARLVRQAFRWGVREELVPVGVWQALKAVGPLRSGPGLRERPKVGPAPEDAVEAVLGLVGPMWRDMIRLQRLTGMRPGEVCGMRAEWLERNGEVWLYRPEAHKTAWRGREKVVPVGPRAQAILAPHLERHPRGWLFRSKYRPDRAVSVPSYNATVWQACRRAGVARWSPNQLRHAAATAIRREHGVEAAQVVLGHAQVAITEIYAAKSLELAVRVAKEMG